MWDAPSTATRYCWHNVSRGRGCSGVGDSTEEPYELTLEFPKVFGAEASSLSKQVVLGSVARAAGKDSSPVTYDVTLPAGTTLFAVDAPKGTVAPGATTKARVLVLHHYEREHHCICDCACRNWFTTHPEPIVVLRACGRASPIRFGCEFSSFPTFYLLGAGDIQSHSARLITCPSGGWQRRCCPCCTGCTPSIGDRGHGRGSVAHVHSQVRNQRRWPLCGCASGTNDCRQAASVHASVERTAFVVLVCLSQNMRSFSQYRRTRAGFSRVRCSVGQSVAHTGRAGAFAARSSRWWAGRRKGQRQGQRRSSQAGPLPCTAAVRAHRSP